MRNFLIFLWVNLCMITDIYLRDPPPFNGPFFMTQLFSESQKVVTLLLFPPSPTPLLIPDKSLNAEMAQSCFEVSHWPIQICYMPHYRLFTLFSPYSSVRSSRSSTLCYGQPSWMSVKTTWGVGSGLEGSEKNSPWAVLTLIQGGCP